MLKLKEKCIIKQCSCGKSFSKSNGNIEKCICDTCLDKYRAKDAKRKLLSTRINPPKETDDLEKITDFVEE